MLSSSSQRYKARLTLLKIHVYLTLLVQINDTQLDEAASTTNCKTELAQLHYYMIYNMLKKKANDSNSHSCTSQW